MLKMANSRPKRAPADAENTPNLTTNPTAEELAAVREDALCETLRYR